MSNVNNILKDIKANETLSRSWRAASSGSTYAPCEGELWRIYPSEAYGSPLGGQTAVKGVCGDIERAFWPSWLIKTYPVPQNGSSKVSLKGHLLDGNEVSSIPLEDLLAVLQDKDIKVASVEAIVALKKVYNNGQFVDLRKEVVKLYHWETVERTSSSK